VKGKAWRVNSSNSVSAAAFIALVEQRAWQARGLSAEPTDEERLRWWERSYHLAVAADFEGGDLDRRTTLSMSAPAVAAPVGREASRRCPIATRAAFFAMAFFLS
jgi:hypothetical protein